MEGKENQREEGKRRGRKAGGEERRQSVASQIQTPTLLCAALWYGSQMLFTFLLCHLLDASLCRQRALERHRTAMALGSSCPSRFWCALLFCFIYVFFSLTWKAQLWSTWTFQQVALQPDRPLWWMNSAPTFGKFFHHPHGCVSVAAISPPNLISLGWRDLL